MNLLAYLAQEEPIPDLPAYGFEPSLMGLLNLAIVVLLPLLVGLVTKSSTGAGVKAVILLALSGLSSVIMAWQAALEAGTVFNWVGVVYTTAINFAIAVAVHFGLWKPTGAASAAQSALVSDRPPPGVTGRRVR